MANERPSLAWAIGVVVGLTLFAVVRSVFLPEAADFWVNTAMGLLLVGFGLGAGLGLSGLGLGRSTWARGLGFGVAAWAGIAIPLALAAALPGTQQLFEDQRSDVTFMAMLLAVFIVIPLGTALLEEVAFRGVLFGLFATRTSVWRAAWISSILFGLWHIPPTLSTASSNEVMDRATREPLMAAAFLAGVVVAMTFAGLVFCWLRIRSRSLIAPFVFHAGVNGTAFFLAWLVS